MKLQTFKRAASESVMARMVTRICGVAGTDRWHEAVQRASESEAANRIPWSLTEMRLYPWMENVSRTMFACSKKDELIMHLISDVGTVYVVNDSDISGKDGLWLMVADDAANADNNSGYAVASAPVLMLTNHAFFDDQTYTITAIQFISCLRQ